MSKARHRINLINIGRRPGLLALALALALGLWAAGPNPVRAAFEIQPGQTRDFNVAHAGFFGGSCSGDPSDTSIIRQALCQIDGSSLPPTIKVDASIFLGVGMTARATGEYGYEFFVPTGPSGVLTVLEAQVSGKAEWNGFFSGAGAFGSSAEFRLTVSLIDIGSTHLIDPGSGTVVASTVVHENELSDALLLRGGIVDKDGEPSTSRRR